MSFRPVAEKAIIYQASMVQFSYRIGKLQGVKQGCLGSGNYAPVSGGAPTWTMEPYGQGGFDVAENMGRAGFKRQVH